MLEWSRLTAVLSAGLLALGAAAGLSACGSSLAAAQPGKILTVGAENEYANVISQIGGRDVQVSAIIRHPNVVVQNGLGYDDFMDKVESASSSSSREVIDVQKLLRLPASTPNPHLWYKPSTMPAVAAALVSDLSALQPRHAAYFAAAAARFDRSLQPWRQALARFSKTYPGTAVATTEPVGDDLLQAAGIRNLTPFSMQADIMNGTDPAPQAVALQDRLFAAHRVSALVYNQQVTDTVTQDFLAAASRAGVPVVGVYETMPTPGYDYQTWMMAELRALQRAIVDHVSTGKL